MDFLLEKLEHAKEQYKDNIYMSPCCNASWAKLDKYYSLTDRSPIYIASLVLCPQWKWTYFEANWPITWLESGRTTVQELWHEYKPHTLPVTSQELSETKNEYHIWRNSKKASPNLARDEYILYCSSPIVDIPDTNPRSWWLERTQRNTFPNLSLMALDILSIPAMAAEPERLFSGAKITISDRRNRLGIKSIEATECLKSWMNTGSLNWVDIVDS